MHSYKHTYIHACMHTHMHPYVQCTGVCVCTLQKPGLNYAIFERVEANDSKTPTGAKQVHSLRQHLL